MAKRRRNTRQHRQKRGQAKPATTGATTQQAVKLAPARFLRQLGIKRIPPDQVFPDRFREEAERAGGTPADYDMHGWFAPPIEDDFYVTEAMAKRSLGAGYECFLRTLENLTPEVGFPVAPRRVADLGGGTGVVSLYLAARHPASRIVVYDHWPRQLELGRMWARERRLSNIRYVDATCQQLASRTKPGANDLALCFRGLDLRIARPGTNDILPAVDASFPAHPRPRADVLEAMAALAGLLSADGVGVIECPWSGLGLVHLFEAIRRAGLGVDWRWTRCYRCPSLIRRGIGRNHVFVRRGMPHLGSDSREDATAYIASARSGRVLSSVKCSDSPAEWSRDGEPWLTPLPGCPADEEPIWRLTKKGHLLLLESFDARGEEEPLFICLAGAAWLLNSLRPDDGGDGSDGRPYQAPPKLERFLRHCARLEGGRE
jgi:hypothetical protein